MDKYEFNIKVEQIKKLVNKSDFETAMKIADTIDWRRVRNANLLSMIASVYEKNEEYQEAKDILLIAFERAPIGKRLLYKLTQLALKQGNIQEAESYYREFCELAGDDSRQDILRYLILKAKGAPIEQLIHSLESYTSTELDEKWLYELADLYHQAGMEEQCVKTCDKIMLMFGLGQYVDKAMELKLQYAPLTKYQMDLVENRDKYEEKLRQVEQNSAAGLISQEEISVPEPAVSAIPPVEARPSAPVAPSAPVNPEGAADYGQSRLGSEPHPSPIPVPAPDPSMLRPRAAASGQTAPVYTAPAEKAEDVISGITESFNPEPAVSGTDVTAEEKLVASVREAEVEASLAEEMSRISMDSYTEEPAKTRTRVLNDVKDLKNTETLADKTRILDDIRHIQAARQAEEESPVQAAGKVQPACFFHMMAEARTPEKGLEIAVGALKAAHRILGAKHPVAKITGEKLNQRGILASAAKLAGKDLIVEDAGDLSDSLLEELNQLLAEDTTGMVVVLVDNSRQIDGIRKANPSLAGKFHVVTSQEEAEEFLTLAAARKNQVQQVRQNEVSSQNPSPAQETVSQSGAKAAQSMASSRVGEASPAAAPVRNPEPAAAEKKMQPSVSAKNPVSPAAKAQPAAEPNYSDQAQQPTAAPSRSGGASQPAPAQEHSDAALQPESGAADTVPSAVSASADDENRVMDIDEFAQYCCHYASQIDCSITGKSMLALYERIEIMEEDGVALTKTAAEDLIEEAADKAEKPSLGKRITGLFSSKYDKDGLLILKEEHFI